MPSLCASWRGLGLLLIVACSDSTAPEPVSLASIAGSYRATSLKIVYALDPTVTWDDVASGKYFLDITFQSDGVMFRRDSIAPLTFALHDTGSVFLRNDSVVIAGSLDIIPFAASLTLDGLVLRDSVEFPLPPGLPATGPVRRTLRLTRLGP